MKTQRFHLAAGIGRTGEVAPRPFGLSGTRRSALVSVWIETGNLRQPLACVWVDRALRSFAAGDEDNGTAQRTAEADDDNVPLRFSLCA